MAVVYLALGTNLGDREANLRGALERLREAVEIEAVSSVYRSEPVGFREQPDFWNMALRAGTALEPDALLAAAQAVERALGRAASFRNAPRVIDIDLLLYDRRRIDSPALRVPHPRMLERAFVLRPLVELDPGLRHPATGEKLADRLARAPALEQVEPLFPATRLLGPSFA